MAKHRTVDQQLAEIEGKLARIKTKNNRLQSAQKFLVGTLVLDGVTWS